MRIINKNMEKYYRGYLRESEAIFEDKILNESFQFYTLLDESEERITRNIFEGKLEDTLYNKYYWFMKFKLHYIKILEQNVGLEEQQFFLIEQMAEKLETKINWNILKDIEENIKFSIDNENILMKDKQLFKIDYLKIFLNSVEIENLKEKRNYLNLKGQQSTTKMEDM